MSNENDNRGYIEFVTLGVLLDECWILIRENLGGDGEGGSRFSMRLNKLAVLGIDFLAF